MKTQINYNKKHQDGQKLIVPEEDQRAESNREEINIRKYIAKKLRQKTPLFDVHDRGYHSGGDPYMDKISADMYDQII